MELRVLKCPHCGAPLSPGKFQRQTTCAFCQTQVQIDPTLVHAARYREALERWNAPAAAGEGTQLVVGDTRFRLLTLLAHGEVSEVHAAERDRWPTERVLLKIARDRADRELLWAERDVLLALQASGADGADRFTTLLPQPLLAGDVRAGPFAGKPALALRWAPGFRGSLRDARRAFPSGIAPIVSIWMWRRTLETLAFLHASGVVHGAVLPRHLLVQDGDHGLRLVGFSCAGAPGDPLRALVTEDEPLYSQRLRDGGALESADDIRMSATAMAFALGANAALELPAAVPAELSALIAETSTGPRTPTAWELHEQVGALGQRLFGKPSFHPLKWPE